MWEHILSECNAIRLSDVYATLPLLRRLAMLHTSHRGICRRADTNMNTRMLACCFCLFVFYHCSGHSWVEQQRQKRQKSLRSIWPPPATGQVDPQTADTNVPTSTGHANKHLRCCSTNVAHPAGSDGAKGTKARGDKITLECEGGISNDPA